MKTFNRYNRLMIEHSTEVATLEAASAALRRMVIPRALLVIIADEEPLD